MNCPHCGHGKSRVLETRGDRRVRQCGECLKDFSTYEVIAAFAGRDRGWIHEPAPALTREEINHPSAEVPSKPRQVSTRLQKFHPAKVEDELLTADRDLADLLVSWWNESRWTKNKNAAWTRRAWLNNVHRVLAMPHEKAMALANAGVEMGWQSLQEEYINDVQVGGDGTLMPRDSAMQKAIESWNL